VHCREAWLVFFTGDTGCTSGTCPVQPDWHTSILCGAFSGYLFPKNPKKNKKRAPVNQGKL
jgi:hypothetical protein